ncbi:MAG: hypothetical protein Q8R82_10980 [Hyphomonadaceae bacterium]|nr:hypothetical protein [Hyphomonadaceae bacterium]
MSAPQYASLSAGLLARKGEAKPSQEPSFGSKPWQPPVVPVAITSPPARSQAVPYAPATASNAPEIPTAKVRLNEVAAVWPQAKPSHSVDHDGTGWVPSRGQTAPPVNYAQPVKTTIRLTHAQARAVKLAALVLDKPQQEILTAGLLGRLEALACSDLSSCSCFKAVLEGLKMPVAMEPPLAY